MALELSVAIIARNDREHLRRCLASLGGLDPEGTEIIVVDNGSVDGTAEMTAAEFPFVRLLRNDRNRGVAGARNQALAGARGRFFLILDSDTEVRPGAVETLLACLRSTQDAGLAGPRLVGVDGETQLTCRNFPTPWTTVCRRLDRFASFREHPALKAQMLADWDHGSTRDVDYVIGACQLIRREAWEEVGRLDERIFFGPEDIDYCLRLRLAGWRVLYCPEAVVEHAERRSTRSVLGLSHWRHVQAVLYFFGKHPYLMSRRRTARRLARSPAGE